MDPLYADDPPMVFGHRQSLPNDQVNGQDDTFSPQQLSVTSSYDGDDIIDENSANIHGDASVEITSPYAGQFNDVGIEHGSTQQHALNYHDYDMSNSIANAYMTQDFYLDLANIAAGQFNDTSNGLGLISEEEQFQQTDDDTMALMDLPETDMMAQAVTEKLFAQYIGQAHFGDQSAYYIGMDQASNYYMPDNAYMPQAQDYASASALNADAVFEQAIIQSCEQTDQPTHQDGSTAPTDTDWQPSPPFFPPIPTAQASYNIPSRSTTPELPSNLAGSYTSLLQASIAVNSDVIPETSASRQSHLVNLLDNCRTQLPPPSPRVKSATLGPNTANNRVRKVPKNRKKDKTTIRFHRMRQNPEKVSIHELPPQEENQLEFIQAGEMSDGPEKDAAIEHNNALGDHQKLGDRARNNVAASRSRDRKERAVVYRAEGLARANARALFWQLRAVAHGCQDTDWDNLHDLVKEQLYASYRFDAHDYTVDGPEDPELQPREGERLTDQDLRYHWPEVPPVKKARPARAKKVPVDKVVKDAKVTKNVKAAKVTKAKSGKGKAEVQNEGDEQDKGDEQA
ncbi:hypothetical protein C8034_v009669 [Colletotrichum sidae]|uniref:BZIP domain-containing protein n=1 Tax=Colletotrichum sidae TaxID=1347389 RepID=A0A4R8TLF3_9PEZI|nr:hypothetical protein C8034_v009669 [Colletotrichum sidae]